MDFYELAAKLLMSGQGGDSIRGSYKPPLVGKGKDAAALFEVLELADMSIPFGENSSREFRYQANLTSKGRDLCCRLGGDVDRIAEYFRQQHNPPSPAIDQSTHIHGNNTGAVVAHSKLEDSPIIINSSVTEQLTKIEQALKEDTSLSNEERQDALFDVETLKNQLQRNKPDTTLFDRILTRLGDIASIGSLIAALSGMF